MTRNKENPKMSLAPNQFYPRKGHPIRVGFDTSDPDLARSLRILKEANASGAFGSEGFRCYQLGPELYTVEFYPGGALALLEEKQPLYGARETI
jgi:hypothetical protein